MTATQRDDGGVDGWRRAEIRMMLLEDKKCQGWLATSKGAIVAMLRP